MFKKLNELKDKIGEKVHQPLHTSFKLVHTSYFGAYTLFAHEPMIAVLTAMLFAYCVADLLFHFLGD